MKVFVAAVLISSAVGANAQTRTQQLPSCDLKAQHLIKGEMGAGIKDPRQAHLSMRANILEADLSTAKKGGQLTQSRANQFYKRVETVRAGADRYTKQQGFLSAAETASYDRALDAIAVQACHR